jgi:hypothetical protein
MAAERPAGPDPRISIRVDWVAAIDLGFKVEDEQRR